MKHDWYSIGRDSRGILMSAIAFRITAAAGATAPSRSARTPVDNGMYIVPARSVGNATVSGSPTTTNVFDKPSRPARKPSSNITFGRGDHRLVEAAGQLSAVSTKIAKSERSATSVSNSAMVLPGWNAASNQSITEAVFSSCRPNSRAIASPSEEDDMNNDGFVIRPLLNVVSTSDVGMSRCLLKFSNRSLHIEIYAASAI